MSTPLSQTFTALGGDCVALNVMIKTAWMLFDNKRTMELAIVAD
jgi:hypothetical protein